jgi:NADPH:quinone reductase-like Zn-dependent oxidoreductase
MMKAVIINKCGSLEEMELQQVRLPIVGLKDVLIDVHRT